MALNMSTIKVCSREVSEDFFTSLEVIESCSLLLTELIFSSSLHFVQDELGCLIGDKVNFIDIVSKSLEPVNGEGGLHVLLLMEFSGNDTEVNCTAEDGREIYCTGRIILGRRSSQYFSGTQAVHSLGQRQIGRYDTYNDQCT